IPHGSFVAYLGMEGNKKMTLPYFGNKKVLDFEFDRVKQGDWLKKAGINTPKEYKNIEDTKFPVIIKSFGAAGGKGYFLVNNKQDLTEKIKYFKDKQFIIQQYVVGVPLYIHYFYSPLTKKLEIMSMDRRYETNVDALGRIPFSVDPSYVVVGNSPLVLRESMLPEAYEMGEKVVKKSQELISPQGLFGPFCLETIITSDQKFYVIEISARIVAGTKLFIEGSPYADLLYNEPMSTGRRIAREIKIAIKKNKLKKILD
ncbi:MAG: formate--phosphoribosylaminoimidazolecarboxamide ligase, partial [Patescibacteria group bacterium]